ncbi:MAG: helix-turn-helix transcriptional regulator [Candidatus Coatesbacteria bacterium]
MARRVKSSRVLTVEQVTRLLGERVRAERHRHGFMQAELAERLGLSANFIAHLDRGSRRPSLETIVMMASGLRVPVRELFRS